MKLYKEVEKTGILLIALLVLSTLSTEVFAGKIKRSCNANYYAMVQSFSYRDESGVIRSAGIPYGEMRVTVKGYDFKARGSCGKLVPNRCRKRARNILIDCARAHAKNPNKMPKECRSKNIGDYHIKDLNPILKKHVCQRPLPHHTSDGYLRAGTDVTTLLPNKPYEVKFTLGVRIDGDLGCGPKKPPGNIITLDGVGHGGIVANEFLFFVPLKKFTVTCP